MWTCPNCKTQHSCGCASRTKNNVQCCSSCIGSVASTQLHNNAGANTQLGPNAPKITGITYKQ